MTNPPGDQYNPYEHTQFGGPQSQPQPAQSGPQSQAYGPVDQYGQPLPPQQPYGTAQFGGQPPMGPPQFGGPAKPNFFAALPRPFQLAAASGIFGIVTFFMGFVSWVSLDPTSIDADAEDWAADQSDSFGVPAFITMIFSPGYFLLLLGATGIAAIGLIAVKWRRYLPHVAFLTVIGWLGVLATGLGLPSFIGFGAGAYVSLIFGTFQFALMAAAAFMHGMKPDEE